MLAFDVYVDGERACLAGIADWSLISAHVTALRDDNQGVEQIESLDLYVGGMTQPDAEGVAHHVRWGQRMAFQVGTKITIHVVDTDAPELPKIRFRSDAQVRESAFTDEEIEEMQREDWLRLKAKFEPDE
jgi:hypothetical protein